MDQRGVVLDVLVRGRWSATAAKRRFGMQRFKSPERAQRILASHAIIHRRPLPTPFRSMRDWVRGIGASAGAAGQRAAALR